MSAFGGKADIIQGSGHQDMSAFDPEGMALTPEISVFSVDVPLGGKRHWLLGRYGIRRRKRTL
jgi:hypothetical protein